MHKVLSEYCADAKSTVKELNKCINPFGGRIIYIFPWVQFLDRAMEGTEQRNLGVVICFGERTSRGVVLTPVRTNLTTTEAGAQRRLLKDVSQNIKRKTNKTTGQK